MLGQSPSHCHNIYSSCNTISKSIHLIGSDVVTTNFTNNMTNSSILRVIWRARIARGVLFENKSSKTSGNSFCNYLALKSYKHQLTKIKICTYCMCVCVYLHIFLCYIQVYTAIVPSNFLMKIRCTCTCSMVAGKTMEV